MAERPAKPGLPARLAHDLRGPLAPLQTAAYLLRSGKLDAAKQHELYDLIERQTRRLGAMIDELDDWLRAGQDRLVGATSPVEPVQLLEVAMTGTGCTGGTPPDITDDALLASVRGDQRRLVQLLRTLLEHARAQAGGALPLVRVATEGQAMVIDVIAEAGGAAGAETLLDDALADPGEDALGLRLLVAREIARAHGGSLDASDDAGRLRLRCRLPLSS